MRRRHVSADAWRRIVERQQVSGLPVAVFCRRSRIPQSSFFAWRKKLRKATGFAEVKLSPEALVETSAIELRLSGGRCVVVRPGFDRRTLLELLHALEEE